MRNLMNVTNPRGLSGLVKSLRYNREFILVRDFMIYTYVLHSTVCWWIYITENLKTISESSVLDMAVSLRNQYMVLTPWNVNIWFFFFSYDPNVAQFRELNTIYIITKPLWTLVFIDDQSIHAKGKLTEYRKPFFMLYV